MSLIMILNINVDTLRHCQAVHDRLKSAHIGHLSWLGYWKATLEGLIGTWITLLSICVFTYSKLDKVHVTVRLREPLRCEA